MFKNLFDLGRQRNGKEAIGFFIFYLIGIIVVAAVIGILEVSLTPISSSLVDEIVHVLPISALAIAIVGEKKLWNSFAPVIIALLACALSYFFAVLGLAVLAFLTTYPPKNT